jgi:GDP/UDP-N,N'-diacetylbacillosamine 2-epimerase (hydrolysing)
MKRKICVVTGSRADYGLLRWLMLEIKEDPDLELQILATGMHLSETFGFTYKEIESDGFDINEKVVMLDDKDTGLSIAKSIGSGITGCALALERINPDLIVLLGDRFEIFAAATAALVLTIPVAHLHGGEVTVGAFDESFRHAITKMSHLHFVAAEEYRNRVIQLGENPDLVFNVGGLGVDAISKVKLLTKDEFERKRGVSFSKKNLLITFHPVTLEPGSAEKQMDELLSALENLSETTLIFTLPNADTGAKSIMSKVEKFVENHANGYFFTTLGQIDYLSCVNIVDGVIGNSSSGLTEVPTLRKGTINIGDRQKGRLLASSVICVEPLEEEIKMGLSKLYSDTFKASLVNSENPNGDVGAANKIHRIIKDIEIEGLLKKTFFSRKSDRGIK